MKLKFKIISSLLLMTFIALATAENPITLHVPGKVLIEKDASLNHKAVSIKYKVWHIDSSGNKIYEPTPTSYTMLTPDAIIRSDYSESNNVSMWDNPIYEYSYILITSVNIDQKIIPLYCINDFYPGNVPHSFTLLRLFGTGQVGCVEGNM